MDSDDCGWGGEHDGEDGRAREIYFCVHGSEDGRAVSGAHRGGGVGR
jgi:hypothetical protein